MTLEEKKEKSKKLATIIGVHLGQTISKEQIQEVENWKGRMEFRLSELLDRSQNEEQDIKIECMEEIIKILNVQKV